MRRLLALLVMRKPIAARLSSSNHRMMPGATTATAKQSMRVMCVQA